MRPSRPSRLTRRRGGGITHLAAAATTVALGLALTPGAAGEWTGLLVPAYFGPSQTAAWDQVSAGAAQAPVIAIANVFNGPGTAARDDYRRVIDQVRNHGGRVIGYVHTTYARRAIEEVLRDIERWGDFYTVDGIFVDEMTNDEDPGHLDYFVRLREHALARQPAWIVVGNPGTRTREAYLTEGAADLLVTFEHHDGYLTYTRDSWTRRHPPAAFAHLAYAVSDWSTLTNYVRLAGQRGAAWLYFTDDDLPNPWDRLPTWWNDLVAHLQSLNAREPTRLAIAAQTDDSVRVLVDTLPGPVTLEASADLRQWEPLVSSIARFGRTEVLITTAGQPSRYLRARR